MIDVLQVGPYQTNCCILREGDEVMVIDPGAEHERILSALQGCVPKYIVATHAHWDHVGALPQLVWKTGAQVAAHEKDAAKVYGVAVESAYTPKDCQEAHVKALEEGMQVDIVLNDGDKLELGGKIIEVIHTPGHTPGSICLYCPDDGLLFAGDTLFAGGRHGRTDFKGGSARAMQESLSSKFMDIPDEAAVYSGHDRSSVMGKERALNSSLK